VCRSFAVLTLILIVPPFATGRPRPPNPPAGLPVGKWQIEFANGVVETCEVGQDGKAFESEPLRKSPGTAKVKNGATVITFDDDRLERWTKTGKTWVVEHWCPVSAYPESRPVLGVAKKAK